MWKTLVLGAALVLASSSAFAAPQCNSRDKVLELLGEKYSEAPVAIGVANNGGLVEVLSSTSAWLASCLSLIATTSNPNQVYHLSTNLV